MTLKLRALVPSCVDLSEQGGLGQSLTKQLFSKCDMADFEILVSLYPHRIIAHSGNNIYDTGLEIVDLF